jgi:hypothetical protein
MTTGIKAFPSMILPAPLWAVKKSLTWEAANALS